MFKRLEGSTDGLHTWGSNFAPGEEVKNWLLLFNSISSPEASSKNAETMKARSFFVRKHMFASIETV
jgi:hypothetical protein